jgi:hypothetical protein
MHPNPAFIARNHAFSVIVARTAHTTHSPLLKATLIAELTFEISSLSVHFDGRTMHFTPT